MAFGTDKHISQVMKAHGISWIEGAFVTPLPFPNVSEALRSSLDFAARIGAAVRSEFARRENYIYPILKEVWLPYVDDLILWSQEPLEYDKDLVGTPDYFLARRSPLGPIVIEEPYLMVVEAKRDDFEEGWAQCLAAMVAAKKLNSTPGLVVHGIVTTGMFWEFGRLSGQEFTVDAIRFTMSPLEALLGAIRFLFEQCRLQLPPKSAVA